jgi:hypothetical protein
MEASEQVTARFRAAAEAGDVEGVLATLAPDALLRSPITERVEFRGPAEIRELLRSVFVTISDIRYFADVGDDRTRALFYRAHVNGTPLEEATRIELDDEGRIREITLFFRPLPGLATLTAALAPRIAAGRHGRLRALVARLLLAPLGFVTRAGDRLVTWFA